MNTGQPGTARIARFANLRDMRSKTDVKCLIHFNCVQGRRDSNILSTHPEADLSVFKRALLNLSNLVDCCDYVRCRWIDNIIDSLNEFLSLSWLILVSQDMLDSLCCLGRVKNTIHTHRL